MKLMFRTFQLVLVALLSLGANLPAQHFEKTVNTNLPLKSGGEVVLKNVNGRVVVQGWDEELVEMKARKRVQAENREKAEKVFQEVEIVVDQSSDNIYIRTEMPRKNKGGFWNWVFGKDGSASVDYQLMVPRQCRLRVDNTNGAIEVSGVSGEIELETTNGKIQAREVAGNTKTHTTNGKIEAVFSSMSSSDELEFSTTNGGIDITLPAKAGFELRAKTTNGSIRSDFPLPSEGEHHRQRLQGSVNGGGARVYAETTNGSIHIRER